MAEMEGFLASGGRIKQMELAIGSEHRLCQHNHFASTAIYREGHRERGSGSGLLSGTEVLRATIPVYRCQLPSQAAKRTPLEAYPLPLCSWNQS